ncbi:MAG: hypothetical protein QXT53_02340 [Ignisphaera sp.]
MSSKAVKRINMFLLINDENQLSYISEKLNNICKGGVCSFNIRHSNIIERFYYIDLIVYANIEEIRKHVEELIKELAPLTSWHKIEIVEVK